MSDLKEARKRSVDNLQRLYTVVISLAVTESLRRLLSSFGATGEIAGPKEWLMFVSLIVTVVPFYHGANRYLDATYVTGERAAKHIALLVDFLMLFVEGLLFFGLAMMMANEKLFYTVLAGLFLLDIVWVGTTNLTAQGEPDKMPGFNKWAAINFMAMLALLISVWSNLFGIIVWKDNLITSLALVGVAITRTVLDYLRVWKFYYPTEGDPSGNIPAPAPAPVPKPVVSTTA